MNDKIWLRPSKSPWSLKVKIKLSLWLIIQKTIFRLSPHKFSFFRIFLLKLFGAKIGDNCFIHQSVNIYMPWNLEIGIFSSIDFDTMIYSMSKIKIGDFVSIAYKVNINTGSHDYTDPYFKLITKPVIIENGAFIGTETYISPGVKIGEMAVIGARSVVTKNMPDSYVSFGNPCKPYKIREPKKDTVI